MRTGRRIIAGLCCWSFLQSHAVAEVRLIDPGLLAPEKGETLTLQFHVDELQVGTRVRVTAINGQVQARPVTQTGLLVVDYHVSKLMVVAREVLSIRARSMSLEDTVELQFQSQPAKLRDLSFEPAWIESRPGGAAQVEIRTPLTEHPPWLRTSFGEIGPPRKSGSDWAWTWSSGSTPEASAVAAFLLMEPNNPEQPAAWGTLPMHITQSLTLKAPPGYICELVQGDWRSEGVAVTPAGTLAMSMAVDPTKTEATVECKNPVGQARSYPVELQLGEIPRHVLGAWPPSIPADPGTKFPAHVLVLNADGSPARVSAIQMESSQGSFQYPEATDFPGVWRSDYTPGPDSAEVQIDAQQDGYSQTLSVTTLPISRTLVVEAQPPVLSPEETTVELLFQVQPAGSEAPAGLPRVETTGAQTISRLRATDNGSIQRLRLGRGQPGIWVQSSAPASSMGLPPTDVTAWAPSPIFLADGESRRAVAIGVSDALSQGVPDVRVQLELVPAAGGAQISPEVRTGPGGVAWAWLTAGTTDGPLVVRAKIDGDFSSAPLHALPANSAICQEDPTRCEPIFFVLDGDSRSRQQEIAWRERVKLSWIPFEESDQTQVSVVSEGSLEAVDTLAIREAASNTAAPDLTIQDISSGSKGPTVAQPRLRITVEAASIGHVYAAQSVLGAAAPTPQQFQRGNLLEGNPIGTLGGTAHLVLRAGELYIEGNWLGGTTRLGSDSSLGATPFHHGWLGIRKSWDIASQLNGYILGGADYQSFLVLMYDTSNPGELILSNIGTPGARIGGGMGWTNGSILTEIEVSEALVPWPVSTTGRLRVEIRATPWMVASLGLAMNFRTARFAAGTDEVSLQDQLHVLSIGIGTSLP